MSKKNFLKDIQDTLENQTVEAVQFLTLLNDRGWFDDPEPEPRNKGIILGKLYAWEEAKPLLDYEYNAGYGGMDCHGIYIWTPQSVLIIHEYDGSTWPELIPRHPVPDMIT